MGTTVLVVDDDASIRDALRDVLSDEGFTVLEAPDGEAALQRLADHPTGMVVLLDLKMPGVDGFSVLAAIEVDSALAARHAYIIMSAGYSTLPLATRLHRLGAAALDKPFDVDTLLAAVTVAAQRLPPAV